MQWWNSLVQFVQSYPAFTAFFGLVLVALVLILLFTLWRNEREYRSIIADNVAKYREELTLSNNRLVILRLIENALNGNYNAGCERPSVYLSKYYPHIISMDDKGLRWLFGTETPYSVTTVANKLDILWMIRAAHRAFEHAAEHADTSDVSDELMTYLKLADEVACTSGYIGSEMHEQVRIRREELVDPIRKKSLASRAKNMIPRLRLGDLHVDLSAVSDYIRTCEEAGIVPISLLPKHLHDAFTKAKQAAELVSKQTDVSLQEKDGEPAETTKQS